MTSGGVPAGARASMRARRSASLRTNRSAAHPSGSSGSDGRGRSRRRAAGSSRKGTRRGRLRASRAPAPTDPRSATAVNSSPARTAASNVDVRAAHRSVVSGIERRSWPMRRLVAVDSSDRAAAADTGTPRRPMANRSAAPTTAGSVASSVTNEAPVLPVESSRSSATSRVVRGDATSASMAYPTRDDRSPDTSQRSGDASGRTEVAMWGVWQEVASRTANQMCGMWTAPDPRRTWAGGVGVAFPRR